MYKCGVQDMSNLRSAVNITRLLIIASHTSNKLYL